MAVHPVHEDQQLAVVAMRHILGAAATVPASARRCYLNKRRVTKFRRVPNGVCHLHINVLGAVRICVPSVRRCTTRTTIVAITAIYAFSIWSFGATIVACAVGFCLASVVADAEASQSYLCNEHGLSTISR
jgi:hypothetical protein